MSLEVVFDAALWEYQGEASWFFVTLPVGQADLIEDHVSRRKGFGSVKVEVELGASRWRTSVFPDKTAGSFVLPIKRAIRENEGLEAGDIAHIVLQVETS